MFGYNKIPNVYAIGSLILMTAVCRGTTIISNGQMAVAVIASSRSILTCNSSDATVQHGFSWQVSNGQYIAYAGGPGSPCSLQSGVDRNRYTVSAPSNGSYCNLIIINATIDEAGSYTCGDGIQGTATVNLIVLNSGPHCSTDAVNGKVVYPGQVTMNCSVQYNSSSGWIPSLQWTPTGSISSGTSGTTAYSTITYYTSASTPMPSYSCSVVYNSSVVVDIPSCSTNPVNVFWCPRAVTISGASGGYIAYGNSLTCSASGNPSPTYQWFNSTNNLLANGPSLTVLNTDNYTCTASNNADRIPCSTSVTQCLNGLACIARSCTNELTQTTTQEPTTTQTPSAATGSTAAAIVLGILFAVAVIFNLICITYIIIMKRNQAAGDTDRIYDEPQNTNTPQEASSTLYTPIELPTFREGSESMMNGRGERSIYEESLNMNVDPETSSTMYSSIELPIEQGGATKDGLYEKSLKTG